MSNWLDVIAYIVGLALFASVVAAAVYAAKVISSTIDETKKSLNAKGVNVSSSGISVKTDKHMTREDYLDATQRGVFKALQTSTTSDSGVMARPDGSQYDSSSIRRSSSGGSNRSTDSAKKKSSLFGIRKSVSKRSNHST